MIRSNGERLDHQLRCANPPGLPPAVHHAADPAAEADFAVERAAARIRRNEGEVAVLYRTNAQSGALENAFRRAGIRYRVTGGDSFYNRPEILDALCCLQAAADPDGNDEAMRRFADLAPHPRTGRRIAAEIDRFAGPSFWSRASQAARSGTLPDYHTANLRLRLELAAALRDAACRLPLDQLVDETLARTGYRQAAAASADADAEDRLDNLAELGYDASIFAGENGGADADAPEGRLRLLAAFLEHCRSMRTPERGDDAGVRVTLSTLHGAKGLEFDTVVVAGFDAEHLPHRRTVASAADPGAAIEEERRLAYVGMTRARTELYLSVPAVTGHGAKQRPTAPSPFLAEIPERLRTLAHARRPARRPAGGRHDGTARTGAFPLGRHRPPSGRHSGSRSRYTEPARLPESAHTETRPRGVVAGGRQWERSGSVRTGGTGADKATPLHRCPRPPRRPSKTPTRIAPRA